MSKFSIVPKEDYEVLKKYLGTEAVVLLPEHILEQFPDDVQKKAREMNEHSYVDYDFGGEPDIYVDIVLSEGSYVYGALFGGDDDDEE